MPEEHHDPIDWTVADTIKPGKSSEPLVPASASPHWITWPIYFKDQIDGALPDIWVREGVYNRLIAVPRSLPTGLRLVVLDGWRPKRVQEALFKKARAKIARRVSDPTGRKLDQMAKAYVALPSDDPISPSPHITGGSVDVTLADLEGNFLDMGSAFDEPSERSWTAHEVSHQHRMHRDILLGAMTRSGFTNLPTEWWHYDYGNWIWAWQTGETAAKYGPVKSGVSALRECPG